MNTIKPVLVALLGGLLTYYLRLTTVDAAWIIIFKALVCFIFGLTLANIKKKKQTTWLKKVIVAFVVFFMIIWQTGIIIFPELEEGFTVLGFTEFGYQFIYIYCGWIFFD